VLTIVKYKPLLFGKLSNQELSIILLTLDDYVRERHDPREWPKPLGVALNLKEVPDSLIPFIRKIHSRTQEPVFIASNSGLSHSLINLIVIF
jgi:hypothetical protein